MGKLSSSEVNQYVRKNSDLNSNNGPSPRQGGNASLEPLLEFQAVRKLIGEQLEPVETNRVMRKFPCDEDQQVTFREICEAMRELLEQDMKDCLTHAFEKLAIR